MPTANPIAPTFSTVTKTTTTPNVAAVKQETGPGTFALKHAALVTAPTTATLSTTITPSPIAAPSTIQNLHVHVPTPVTLQSTVHVPKATAVPQPIPVTTHSSHSYPAQTLSQSQPSGKVMTRTINRVTASSVQNPAALSAPRPKTSPSAKPSKKKKAAICMATAQAAAASAISAAGENTGRWTAEEHRLFLQGLEQHGKGWKKIASLIKSRTVVQIRTHAQKYFQKIAKARQNGEEGEVSMENRERVIVSNNSKRKRGGNKRKAISSVVASAAKEGKKQCTDKSKNMVSTAETGVPLPMVAPSLTPYVYSYGAPSDQGVEGDGIVTPTESTVPSITTAHGTISGAALEDSLFRFLTPMPNEGSEGSSQVNDVARQAGANPIMLPSGSKATHPQYDGEVSPTGVVDFPSDWAWNSEPPAWYVKGADVDELLNEADALDWLADSGDLHETYDPPDHSKMSEPSLMSLVESDDSDPIKVEPTFVSAPRVPILDEITAMATSASSGNMPPLPSMFDSGNDLPEMKKEQSVTFSSTSLFASATEAADAVEESEHFKLLDEQFDEQAFVTALLDQTGDSASHLNHIHMDQ
jgi:SHAQKYF class myb-like DNA-binding protein